MVDDAIKWIANILKDNELFVVFSDHGMSNDKIESHGGFEPEQWAAFYFAYSKSKPFTYEQRIKEITSADLGAITSTLINTTPPYMNLGIYEQGIAHEYTTPDRNLDQIKTLVERLHNASHID